MPFKGALCSLIELSVRLNAIFLADPGKARGWSANTSVIYSLNHSFIDWLIPTALQCHHAETVRNRSSRFKIDYVIVIQNFLNLRGHQNPISGSKFTVILVNGWFCLLVELQRARVCGCSLRSRIIKILPWVCRGLWSLGAHRYFSEAIFCLVFCQYLWNETLWRLEVNKRNMLPDLIYY